MHILKPHIHFDGSETLVSYAARLAAIHTGLGTQQLLSDLGINRQAFLSGNLAAVAQFSERTGSDYDQIRRGTIRLLPRHNEFRGEAMSREFINPRVTKICPQCLAKDRILGGYRHQVMWTFRCIRSCEFHGMALIETGATKAMDLRQVATSILLSGAGRGTAQNNERPSFAAWLSGRLNNRSLATDWTADQTIEQVIAAAEMIGAVMTFGHDVNLKRVSAVNLEDATERGFRIYMQGHDVVAEALTEIRRASQARAVQAGPLAMYGRLFDWLDRRANLIDPGPIRDILRDHIVEHSAVGHGDVVLGVEIARRKFHSLNSLVEVTGIERRRLSRLLQKTGLVPEGMSDAESGRLVFPATDVEDLCADISDAIQLQDAPDFIGASKGQFLALYAAGIVSPIFPVEERGAVRNVVFAQRHLNVFLKKIAELIILESDGFDDFQSISYACQRGGGTTADVVARILNGKLFAMRRSGEPGLSKVLVRPSEAIATKDPAAA